ncbi:hypothetical protein V6N13_059057 [Hibiscus sabdariffa]
MSPCALSALIVRSMAIPPSELKQHVGPSKGSRFNPLPDEFDDVVEIENVVDSAPAEGAIPPATAPHHKGKPISVLKKQREIPIHKPLRVTLNDFPIVAKSATKPSSLCSTQMRNNTTTLDKTRHSSIVISENSDPNLQIPALAHNATPACTNTLTLGKSPDTRTALHAELNAEDMCLNQTSYMATVDSRLDAHGCGHPKFHSIVRQYLRDSNGFSGGIWIAWFDSITVDIILNHFQFVHCCITDKRNDTSTLATIIYASPNATKRKALWSNLCHLASSICSPWILFGDLNATLCTSERMGGSPSMKPCRGFQELVYDVGLRDMGFAGPVIHGNEALLKRGLITSYATRIGMNLSWILLFSISSV